jgi:uncharacterized protein YheU (UPF0270 family)
MTIMTLLENICYFIFSKLRLDKKMIAIPYKELSPEALQGVIEEFVTRDGTDYGESEVALDTKVNQILHQLHVGEAVIVFDQKTETCNIVSKDALGPDIIK